MNQVFSQLQKYAKFEPEKINDYLGIALKIVLILIFAKLIVAISDHFIKHFVKLSPKLRMDEKKTNTISTILRSVVKYTVYLTAIASILSAMNILTKPIIAAAGLGGIAIGFGAQSLIRDIFTGFFILFEDQYGVGDYITIGAMTGTVEELGLRITKIRAINGDLHIIPNGEIKTVTNHSRGNSLAIIDVGIAYGQDTEKAIEVLKEMARKYYEENIDKLVEPPEVLGINRLSEFEITIRINVRTKPLEHWPVEREIRKRSLEAFKENDIEVPFPKNFILNKK